MIITLTTDFGDGSPYLAAMKGVILGIQPAARIVDLTHRVPPQDLRYADFFLAQAVPCFPPGAIHVVVVDPGVGSDRRLLYVEAAGQRLLLPDNGCWTSLARQAEGNLTARALTDGKHWRQPVSPTFHGRDILAPLAAHLSMGLDPAQLGPAVSDWVVLQIHDATLELGGAKAWGEVVFVDRFGNLITNIPAAMIEAVGPAQVRIGEQTILHQVRTYADAPASSLVALISSFDTLEIAVVGGSATARLGVWAGALVTVIRLPVA